MYEILKCRMLITQPVFDPDFHTELIIKDEYKDSDSGNVETYIKTVKNTSKL